MRFDLLRVAPLTALSILLLCGCEAPHQADNPGAAERATERAIAAEAELLKQEYAKNRSTIHADVERLHAEGKSGEAIQRGALYLRFGDPELAALIDRAQASFNKQKEKRLLGEIKARKPTDHYALLNKYMELEELDPSNENYRRQRKKHSAALDRIAQKEAQRRAGPFRPGDRGSALGSGGAAREDSTARRSPNAGDLDKLTTYAVVIGRATACGVDTRYASQRVGAWMDQVFPPGSADQQTYLPIFMDGVVRHAQMQKSGSSPDSCSTVLRTFNGFPWP